MWGCRFLVLDAENGRHQRTAYVNNVRVDRSTYSTTQSLQSNAAVHQKQQHCYMSARSMSRQRWWLMCRSKSGSESVENKWAGVICVNIKCLTVLVMALVIAMVLWNAQRLGHRMNFDYILFTVPLRTNPDYFIDPPTFSSRATVRFMNHGWNVLPLDLLLSNVVLHVHDPQGGVAKYSPRKLLSWP